MSHTINWRFVFVAALAGAVMALVWEWFGYVGATSR